MPRVFAFVFIATLAVASDVRAQDQWGLSVGLTPAWQTGDPVRFPFRADQIDMRGSEARFGVVRGDLLGNDWGLSFVDKSIDEKLFYLVPQH